MTLVFLSHKYLHFIINFIRTDFYSTCFFCLKSSCVHILIAYRVLSVCWYFHLQSLSHNSSHIITFLFMIYSVLTLFSWSVGICKKVLLLHSTPFVSHCLPYVTSLWVNKTGSLHWTDTITLETRIVLMFYYSLWLVKKVH